MCAKVYPHQNFYAKSKQTAHDTPLFRATYKLYLAWYRHCQIIPKKDRFAIGQKTENLLLEIMTLPHERCVPQKRNLIPD